LKLKYVASYLALYAATLALLVRYEHFQILEPLLILLVVGGAFTLITWLLTRRAEPLLVAEPRAGVLWYLAAAFRRSESRAFRTRRSGKYLPICFAFRGASTTPKCPMRSLWLRQTRCFSSTTGNPINARR